MASQRYVTVPEQAILSQAIVDRLRLRLPRWTPDESDPAVYISDDTAARLRVILAQWNLSADQNWMLKATGDALLELARNVGILSKLEGETDDELRQRMINQFNALAPGTPPHDLLRAFLADPLVRDASRSLDADRNTVTIYVVDLEGEDLPDTTKTVIQAALNLPNRPAFWLDYVVGAVTITEYTVDATIIYKRGSENPEPVVTANLASTLIALRKLDISIYSSALRQGMWTDDVVDIAITAPASTLLHFPEIIYHGVQGVLTFTEET